MGKKTVVIGASPNPERYSYLATQRLANHAHEVIAVGLRSGKIGTHEIVSGFPAIENVDTVTLYVGPANQPYWYDYILSLKPKRIIFNPGTENDELIQKAESTGIECMHACTLVLLGTGSY